MFERLKKIARSQNLRGSPQASFSVRLPIPSFQGDAGGVTSRNCEGNTIESTKRNGGRNEPTSDAR